MLKSIQLVSDLHIERSSKYLDFKQTSDILIIAGDFGDPSKISYARELGKLSKKYRRILLVSGNHEYYQTSLTAINIISVNNIIQDIINYYPNVEFLNYTTSRIGQYVVAGTTLWTDSQPNHNEPAIPLEHKKSVKWLETFIEEHKEPKIIITHHSPSFSLQDKAYKNYKPDRYSSNLNHLIHQVDYWFCGHLHTQKQREIGKCKIAINAHTLKTMTINLD